MPDIVKNVLWGWLACMIMYGGTVLFAFALVSIMI